MANQNVVQTLTVRTKLIDHLARDVCRRPETRSLLKIIGLGAASLLHVGDMLQSFFRAGYGRLRFEGGLEPRPIILELQDVRAGRGDGLERLSVSIVTPVSVDQTVVLASDPEIVEAQYTDLKGVKASGSANQITLEISREPFTDEPWPAGRMTYERFFGLRR